MLNLEPLAAQAANAMVDHAYPKVSENTMTKALAVLTEQGVYAFGWFLATRKEQERRAVGLIDTQIRLLLNDTGLYTDTTPDKATYYRGISALQEGEGQVEALRRLLLTKQLMEITLTYGRYHAKSMNHD
ncbi:MAG: hypothetical protein ACR2HF_07810 [Methylococcaceae bacterium]